MEEFSKQTDSILFCFHLSLKSFWKPIYYVMNIFVSCLECYTSIKIVYLFSKSEAQGLEEFQLPSNVRMLGVFFDRGIL